MSILEKNNTQHLFALNDQEGDGIFSDLLTLQQLREGRIKTLCVVISQHTNPAAKVAFLRKHCEENLTPEQFSRVQILEGSGTNKRHPSFPSDPNSAFSREVPEKTKQAALEYVRAHQDPTKGALAVAVTCPPDDLLAIFEDNLDLLGNASFWMYCSFNLTNPFNREAWLVGSIPKDASPAAQDEHKAKQKLARKSYLDRVYAVARECRLGATFIDNFTACNQNSITPDNTPGLDFNAIPEDMRNIVFQWNEGKFEDKVRELREGWDIHHAPEEGQLVLYVPTKSEPHPEGSWKRVCTPGAARVRVNCAETNESEWERIVTVAGYDPKYLVKDYRIFLSTSRPDQTCFADPIIHDIVVADHEFLEKHLVRADPNFPLNGDPAFQSPVLDENAEFFVIAPELVGRTKADFAEIASARIVATLRAAAAARAVAT